jgi:hypothetical protein
MDMFQLLLILIGGAGPVEVGFAPHYAPAGMRAVAERRNLRPAACMVASPHYAIGDWVWLYGLQTRRLLRCQVVDVSAPKDRARHHRTRRVVELSYENTRAVCGALRERADHCPVVVVGATRKSAASGEAPHKAGARRSNPSALKSVRVYQEAGRTIIRNARINGANKATRSP